ncbi:pyruvate/proton symporter CstA [Salmonella enterica subsp. enterica]|uniref:Carbon starvation protein CstA n=2 Tax=Salmonella enterica TaxID=28901 RepID=A0A722NZZ6_SALER|nr:pyruvate/proton symporter CstA [Salmonella enterica]HDI5147451.1 carbon starvation protein CstA [Salmonella enterica subsp. enterica serovar Choleraesuis]AAX64537.1 carbon starvation protein [Salmonella enterica subsp. enterica serovar Choleraesuis str. SC-B67]EEK7907777.1 carbon starvation protein CstA [Salmonella enterica]HAD8889614.1 carbon starvation protein CstA [Salmonella enterica]HAD9108727.1 carbon starvation protein CstA [Salmonella enterica]
MNKSGKYLVWTALSVLGAFALGYIALNRGEQINALWIVVASVCVYLIAYRFYGLYIAKKVLAVDPTRMTPAVRHNDGLDYVPTDKKVLFGHHFAAIAGAGPLVGPVLAAQMGYLPGMIWLLAGVVLAGAVQDFMVLFVSTRRDGRSLGELVKEEMGATAGVIALVACFMIMVIILAVLAMIVVKALTHSPWGTYTVAFTIPLAIFMGIYLRYLRPGRIGEVSVIGLVFLIFAIISGGWVAASPTWAPYFDFTGVQLTWMLVGYGFVAAVLPVWLLLAPRDYLSTFLKIGTIVGLAVGILIMRPTLTMPALTKFVDGTGPVWTGDLFPFLFITIACGAVSGFHALISSGTTPKMLANEGQACFIGYGGMLMESFVAIMALVSACIIDPGVYFAMNSPMAVLAPAGTADVVASAAQVVSSWGFAITPDTLHQIANEVGEQSIISRAGGAPTLAVGMAYILHGALGGMMDVAFWYHFAILFEALFILTAVDAGTRAARFMLQDLLGVVSPGLKRTDSLPANLLATALCVLGYFLHQGVVDPLGGINTLWPLFGIANQMLAGMALMLCAVVLFKMKRQRYAWVALVPTAWLLICTLTAGWQKAFSPDAKIGFLAIANKFQAMIDSGNIPPQYTESQLAQLVFNNRLDAGLTIFFMVVVVVLAVFSIKTALAALKIDKPTANETPYEPMPENVDEIVTQAKGAH